MVFLVLNIFDQEKSYRLRNRTGLMSICRTSRNHDARASRISDERAVKIEFQLASDYKTDVSFFAPIWFDEFLREFDDSHQPGAVTK